MTTTIRFLHLLEMVSRIVVMMMMITMTRVWLEMDARYVRTPLRLRRFEIAFGSASDQWHVWWVMRTFWSVVFWFVMWLVMATVARRSSTAAVVILAVCVVVLVPFVLAVVRIVI